MQNSSHASHEPIKLNCLKGQPAPPIVIAGWKQMILFPEQARKAYWSILAPVLLLPDHAANQNLITLFCKEHEIAPDAVLAAVGCCEVLLKQAAALDLTVEAFRQDLLSLSEDGGDLAEFVSTRYPEAKKELRQKILMETLAAHGKVMTDLEWRLDKVQHSSKGNHLNTDIVLLTLHYREGQKQDTITLQLTRETAQSLRIFCDRFDNRSKG
jgi:hypothetical protein